MVDLCLDGDDGDPGGRLEGGGGGQGEGRGAGGRGGSPAGQRTGSGEEGGGGGGDPRPAGRALGVGRAGLPTPGARRVGVAGPRRAAPPCEAALVPQGASGPSTRSGGPGGCRPVIGSTA